MKSVCEAWKILDSYHANVLVLLFLIVSSASIHERIETEQKSHVDEQERQNAYDYDDHNLNCE